MRRHTKEIKIGNVKIGGSNPILVQSMTKTDTRDIQETLDCALHLQEAGCEIIRVAVKDMEAARAVKEIKHGISIPLEVDIHFHYKLALESILKGADAVRLNPGNIYKQDEVKAVVKEAKNRNIPIRVGLNSGSVKGDMLKAANDYIRLLESLDFYDIMVSLKCSDVTQTVLVNRQMAKLCDYPFHLGITATGLPEDGIIKSSIGIGTLLLDGIGDTLRVSLAGDPKEEVVVGRHILEALNLRRFSSQLIACPTCGRCEIDLVGIASKVKERMQGLVDEDPRFLDLSVAVMGCVVNGPGEAQDADVALAGGNGVGIIYRKGKLVKKVKESDMVDELIDEVVRGIHSNTS